MGCWGAGGGGWGVRKWLRAATSPRPVGRGAGARDERLKQSSCSASPRSLGQPSTTAQARRPVALAPPDRRAESIFPAPRGGTAGRNCNRWVQGGLNASEGGLQVGVGVRIGAPQVPARQSNRLRVGGIRIRRQPEANEREHGAGGPLHFNQAPPVLI